MRHFQVNTTKTDTRQSIELKECTYCHRKLPKTSEFFQLVFKKQRGKHYFQPRCLVCLRKLNKAYREKNRDKLRASHRKYDRSPKGIYKKLQHSVRGRKVTLTQEEFIVWYNHQPKKCCYCGLKEEELQLVSDAYNNKTHRLTVDRIDSSRDYEMGNLALACLRCNHIKGDLFSQSEMEEIGQRYISTKWREQIIQT